MSDVRAECKRRFGDKGEPIDTKECADWCPLLGRRIEEEEVDDADLVDDANAD